MWTLASKIKTRSVSQDITNYVWNIQSPTYAGRQAGLPIHPPSRATRRPRDGRKILPFPRFVVFVTPWPGKKQNKRAGVNDFVVSRDHTTDTRARALGRARFVSRHRRERRRHFTSGATTISRAVTIFTVRKCTYYNTINDRLAFISPRIHYRQ